MQHDPATGCVAWRWYERLVLFCIGAGLGGLIFCAIQSGYLSLKRPSVPELALGYTYVFNIKFRDHYGTYFEYFAVTYGFWLIFGLMIVGGIFAHVLKFEQKSRAYHWQVLTAAAISIPAYIVLWWAFL
jgi:hypothetical protein